MLFHFILSIYFENNMNNISTYNQAEAAYRRIKEKNARLKEKVMQ